MEPESLSLGAVCRLFRHQCLIENILCRGDDKENSWIWFTILISICFRGLYKWGQTLLLLWINIIKPFDQQFRLHGKCFSSGYTIDLWSLIVLTVILTDSNYDNAFELELLEKCEKTIGGRRTFFADVTRQGYSQNVFHHWKCRDHEIHIFKTTGRSSYLLSTTRTQIRDELRLSSHNIAACTSKQVK